MVRDRSGIDKNTPSVTVDTTDNQLPEPYTQNLDLTTRYHVKIYRAPIK